MGWRSQGGLYFADSGQTTLCVSVVTKAFEQKTAMMKWHNLTLRTASEASPTELLGTYIVNQKENSSAPLIFILLP